MKLHTLICYKIQVGTASPTFGSIGHNGFWTEYQCTNSSIEFLFSQKKDMWNLCKEGTGVYLSMMHL